MRGPLNLLGERGTSDPEHPSVDFGDHTHQGRPAQSSERDSPVIDIRSINQIVAFVDELLKVGADASERPNHC